MGGDPGWQSQSARQFFTQHRLSISAAYDMKLMLGRIQIIQQALGVQSPAGARYGNKYSQIRNILPI